MEYNANWKTVCHQKLKRQHESIPREWLIPVPSLRERPNVMDIPGTCGLLTARELMITETTDVGVILEKLGAAEWTSVETTTAFYKRAIIAHQLVCICLPDV